MNGTNWRLILSDLKNLGITQAEIADAVGLSQGAINQLKSGAVNEPRYTAGVRLLKFYEEAKKDAEEQKNTRS